MELVLRAYGRTWATTAAKNQANAFTAVFEVPSVRVPTVFSVTHATLQNPELAQLVAYPDRDVEWDKNISLYACGAPEWFEQWAAATGLPVKQIALAGLATAELARPDKAKKSLLILGPDAAGKDLADALKLANEKRGSILVLDAAWFGEPSGPVTVGPSQMRSWLAAIATQRWPEAMKFNSRRQPWPGIANRWVWIVDEAGLPLAEELSAFSAPWDASHPALTNYIPWPQQLGRNESADATFRDLLAKASFAFVTSLGWRSMEMVYPKQDKLDKKDRPVLWAAANTPVVWKDTPRSVWVVDLRGNASLPEDLMKQLHAKEEHIGDDADRLLILGDDKFLDECKWLKLDRAKKTINRPGVVWLSDDDLPPSKDNQIRLMLKLTELGVPIATPSPEEKKK